MAQATHVKLLEFCTEIEWKQDLARAPYATGTASLCQISAVVFFLISPIIFLLIEPSLLHGYPRLSSKVFWVNVSNFWHALHEYLPFVQFSF